MISLRKIATIICVRRGCTEIGRFSKEIDWKDDEVFVEEAFLYFINEGWEMLTIDHLCPYCAQGRPTEDE